MILNLPVKDGFAIAWVFWISLFSTSVDAQTKAKSSKARSSTTQSVQIIEGLQIGKSEFTKKSNGIVIADDKNVFVQRWASNELMNPGHFVAPVQSQIVVEMKNIRFKDSYRMIGAIAPESWTTSNDGLIRVTELPQRRNKFWIGVQCVDPITTIESSPLTGLPVKEVVPGSPAEEAGIRSNDHLVKFNSKRLQNVPELIERIQMNGDRKATLSINRGGNSLTLDIRPQLIQQQNQEVRTVMATTFKPHVALKQIQDLATEIKQNTGNGNQSYRLVIVGSGVDFGKEEIEFELKESISSSKQKVHDLLKQVANHKFGIMVHDKLEVREIAKLNQPNHTKRLEAFAVHPGDLWNSFRIGPRGQTIDLAAMTPDVLHRQHVSRVAVGPERLPMIFTPSENMTTQRKPIGRVVFQSPFIRDNIQLQDAISDLKAQNKLMRKQNEDLKEEIERLKIRLNKSAGNSDEKGNADHDHDSEIDVTEKKLSKKKQLKK